MVSMSKAAEKLLRKLPTPARKVAGRRYREAYRRRTASRKLTYEEKKALLQRRLNKKVSLLQDLKDIHAEMMARVSSNLEANVILSGIPLNALSWYTSKTAAW